MSYVYAHDTQKAQKSATLCFTCHFYYAEIFQLDILLRPFKWSYFYQVKTQYVWFIQNFPPNTWWYWPWWFNTGWWGTGDTALFNASMKSPCHQFGDAPVFFSIKWPSYLKKFLTTKYTGANLLVQVTNCRPQWTMRNTNYRRRFHDWRTLHVKTEGTNNKWRKNS